MVICRLRAQDSRAAFAAHRWPMYGLAYVLIPSQFASLQAELDRTLAPFMRGGEKEFPREKLAFDDATDALTRLHRTGFRYNPDGSLTWLDPADASYDLCLASL